MKLKVLPLVALVSIPLALGVLAVRPEAARAESAGAASLKIPPGARAEGMGRTFSAIADDAFAPWWNPGGLGFLSGRNAALMHTQLVPDLATDVYFEYLSYAQYLEGWGGVALTLTYLTYGESALTLPGSPEITGHFRSFEIAPSLAIGTAISNSLGIGANLKYIYEDLAPATSSSAAGNGSTFAVDLGALWKVPGKPVNLAIVVQNLGPNLALVDEKQADPLPRMLRLAAAFQVVNTAQHSLVAAVDGDKYLLSNGAIPDSLHLSWFKKNEVFLNVGAEYTYNGLLSVRAGYIYDDPGSIKAMTYGLGVRYKALSLDYASIPQYSELARVSKFSLSARF
jgi:hypothetical protein